MTKRRPPDLNPAAAFDAVESGRVELGSLSRIQQEAYHAERRRRATEMAMEDDEKQDAARRAANRRAAEEEVADYHRRRERVCRKQPTKRVRRAERIDVELLSEFTVRQSFAAMAAAVVGLLSAAMESFFGSLSGRQSASPPPADRESTLPSAPEYSAAELRAARAEYRRRAEELTGLLQSVTDRPAPSARDIARRTVAYLDYKLSGQIPNLVGCRRVGTEPFAWLGRPLLAGINAANSKDARQWRDGLWDALRSGGAGVRLLREIEAVGDDLLIDYPALGQVLPGVLPPPPRKRDDEAEPVPAPDITNGPGGR